MADTKEFAPQFVIAVVGGVLSNGSIKRIGEFAERIRDNPDKTLALCVEVEGDEATVTVTPLNLAWNKLFEWRYRLGEKIHRAVVAAASREAAFNFIADQHDHRLRHPDQRRLEAADLEEVTDCRVGGALVYQSEKEEESGPTLRSRVDELEQRLDRRDEYEAEQRERE